MLLGRLLLGRLLLLALRLPLDEHAACIEHQANEDQADPEADEIGLELLSGLHKPLSQVRA